ncbi:neutral trehalase [Trichodelitschia bisporula]|uniref:Trehalase n=1 Tax=Trichodelitschia bisporula TaxID=703511 RepID=A0A6G1HQD2_9PEZI|nr:neutral trehalase [Trichodelitschia bisporula]
MHAGILRGADDIPHKATNFIVEVQSTQEALLDREDTDHNHQITIDDTGPKVLVLRTVKSKGFRTAEIRGAYALSNVLGALTFAQEDKEKYAILRWSSLHEGPVTRLARLIKDVFWENLTRRLDASMIAAAATDAKDWTENPQPRIYVPRGAPEQFEYYTRVAKEKPEINLDVQLIPSNVTEEVYKKMLEKPGLLALEMEEFVNPVTGEKDLRGLPFIVPGGRFNELYNWDSYFNAIGLLANGYVHLVQSIVRNFIFEIQHYGFVPNANRSYYLLRSQPPFLTSLALKVYRRIRHEPDSKEFLRNATLAAIKEYNQVWTAEPRYDPKTGLSRYRPQGVGIPPECEKGAFSGLLEPYCKKHNMTEDEFTEAYNSGAVKEPVLDEYFLHDRAVRESGHDVSLRFEGVCADLACIDLNCLLYRYETDIAEIIRTEFDDKLQVPAEFCAIGDIPDRIETSAFWDRKARLRKERIDKYLWDAEKGMYFDYNTKTGKKHTVESATCFWTLWCGVASPRQAAQLVSSALPKFEKPGGLVGTTEESIPNRGKNLKCHDGHQWDYPFGWSPHQILAWDGLRRYGYYQDAERVCYRWLYSIIKVFVDFNGAVVEKYDVTNLRAPHIVKAEYGNQGLDFKGYAKEGFGWTNASFLHGLSIVSIRMRRALEVCATYEAYSESIGAEKF